jgi:hypothetical protein
MRLVLTGLLVLLLTTSAEAGVHHPTRRDARRCAESQLPFAFPNDSTARVTWIGRRHPKGGNWRPVIIKGQSGKWLLKCTRHGPIDADRRK